jgi:uncharacterized protein (DUF1697 family)
MTAFVALLRGVNVGGRKLEMSDLNQIAVKLGFGSPRTFIASGNLLFTSDWNEQELKRELEKSLRAHLGQAVGVMVRTANEMAAIAAASPFKSEPGNKVVAIFLDEPPPQNATESAKNVADERLALGRREIYVHYPSGQGRSKLRIAAAGTGTARNMNSVAKLAELAREME